MTRAARLVGIAGSLGLHALLILSLLHATAYAPAPPPKQHTDLSDMDDPVVKLRGAEAESLVSVTPIAEGITAGMTDCEDSRSYVGIGILISSFGRLLMVGDNTPASRAGLMAGDVIMNPDDLGTHFEPGHVIPLRVVREGVEMAITVAVRRICQD